MTDPNTVAAAASFHARRLSRHIEETERGEHDDRCEWGTVRKGGGRETTLWLCHCSKRRREAAGHTDPPGPLLYAAPTCPRCWNDVFHNGDVFECTTCHVTWDPSYYADRGEFTDEYGSLDE